MSPEDAHKGHDWLIEESMPVHFSATSQVEIDQRLMEDDPTHPDSIELRRIMRESERSSEVATALLLVLQLCLPLNEGRNRDCLTERSAKVAGIKLCTLLWMLQSQRMGLHLLGQTQIAERIGCTRALVSHYARFWNKATGLRCRGQKREGASAAYRAASAKGWAKRRGEAAPADDPLDHADELPAGLRRTHEEAEEDDADFMGDDHVPSWSRGRGEWGDSDGAVD